jgi:hypothetical protein
MLVPVARKVSRHFAAEFLALAAARQTNMRAHEVQDSGDRRGADASTGTDVLSAGMSSGARHRRRASGGPSPGLLQEHGITVADGVSHCAP